MDIALTLGVLGLALVFFIFEWLPVDITAIATAVVLMLLGLVTPKDAASQLCQTRATVSRFPPI